MNMIFAPQLMDYRIDVALQALLLSIGFGVICGFFTFITKKKIPAMPVFEMVLRPIVIALSDRLNRSGRSVKALVVRGLIVTLILLVPVWSLIYMLEISGLNPSIIELALLFLLLAPITPILTAYGFSKEPKIILKQSYGHLSRALNRNTIHLDEYGHRRHSVELLALSLIEWIFMPILLYIIGGVYTAFTGAVLSIIIRVCEKGQFTMIAYFVWGFINKITSVIASLFLVFASFFVPQSNPFVTLKSVGTDILKSYASALRVALGGVYQGRHGQTVKRKWVGEEKATAKIDQKDVLRAIYLQSITLFLIVSALFIMSVAW
jgi:cobalamin biosynthesis protein CobD/CbiB